MLCKDSIENLSFVENDTKIDKKEKQNKLVKLIKRLLTEFKMDPNSRDLADFTPIMFASEHGDMDIIQALIDSKADVNATNNEGIYLIFNIF